MDVAFGERDLAEIKRRARVSKIIKILIKLFSLVRGSKSSSKVVLYPAFSGVQDFKNISNKVSFALEGSGVELMYDALFDATEDTALEGCQVNYQSKSTVKFKLSTLSLKELNQAKFILIHKVRSLLSLKVLINLHKVKLVDPTFFSSLESLSFRDVHYYLQTDKKRNELREESLQKFKGLLEKYKGASHAFCFASGPSYSQYEDFEFPKEGVKIICNSIVKDFDFLQHIDAPDILVFADPVFHYSPCNYSSKFREDVMIMLEKYKDCYVVIPESAYPLFHAHYGETISDRLIGVPITLDEYTFPSEDNFCVKSTANILTMLMLPLASTLSDEVVVLGADGRKPDEKYFWNHNSKVQYGDLMNSVFECHPSFFRDRDYKDYYSNHCGILEQIVSKGESEGKRYSSLTQSYIPVFQQRINNDIKRKVKAE